MTVFAQMRYATNKLFQVRDIRDIELMDDADFYKIFVAHSL